MRGVVRVVWARAGPAAAAAPAFARQRFSHSPLRSASPSNVFRSQSLPLTGQAARRGGGEEEEGVSDQRSALCHRAPRKRTGGRVHHAAHGQNAPAMSLTMLAGTNVTAIAGACGRRRSARAREREREARKSHVGCRVAWCGPDEPLSAATLDHTFNPHAAPRTTRAASASTAHAHFIVARARAIELYTAPSPIGRVKGGDVGVERVGDYRLCVRACCQARALERARHFSSPSNAGDTPLRPLSSLSLSWCPRSPARSRHSSPHAWSALRPGARTDSNTREARASSTTMPRDKSLAARRRAASAAGPGPSSSHSSSMDVVDLPAAVPGLPASLSRADTLELLKMSGSCFCW